MPNTIMNRRMKPMSQRRGLCTNSSSTLSPAIVISGKSVSKLMSRICFGSSGKNGRNSDAPAMLNMFPKFAHAIHEHFEIALEQDKIRGLAGNIDRAFHRETYIRGVQRGRVVDSIA